MLFRSDKEVIFAEDVEEIFGKRPWASRSEEIISASKTSRELKEAEEKEKLRREVCYLEEKAKGRTGKPQKKQL